MNAPIDSQKFNAIYNQLKELVGDRGAFVLLLAKPTDGAGEDMKFHTCGPITSIIGLLNVGTPYLNETLMKNLESRLGIEPRQPD